MSDTIETVRAFNRFYTREIGLLERDYLQSGMSLAEVRVLFEIHGGVQGARQIAHYLDLDEGYLSRLLKGLITRGVLSKTQSKTDRRHSDLKLTVAGATLIDALIQKSKRALEARLSGVTPVNRQRLTSAMGIIRMCLSDNGVAQPYIKLRDMQIGDMGLIASRHGVIYAQEHGFDAGFEPYVATILAGYLNNHNPENERAWVAVSGAHIMGSIFCMQDGEGMARLRLFYLEPEARGLGLGQKMLNSCVTFAKAAGYQRMVLSTHESHDAACALYRKAGFAMIRAHSVHNFGQNLQEQEWQIDFS